MLFLKLFYNFNSKLKFFLCFPIIFIFDQSKQHVIINSTIINGLKEYSDFLNVSVIKLFFIFFGVIYKVLIQLQLKK